MIKIRIDTGGTFTDCRAYEDGTFDTPVLVKLLSSGKLRLTVSQWLSDTAFRIEIPDTWITPEGFFAGFQITDQEGTPSKVTGFDAGSSLISTESPLRKGNSIDLFTGEEAPVVGARLLTGTPMGEDFPPMDFRLATTRGTNALLEKKGASLALFITGGFGDLLRIGDQRRPDLFALEHRKRKALFSQVIEIAERVDQSGKIIIPFDPESPDFSQKITDLVNKGIKIAAVAFLHSYRNPTHERQLRERLLHLGFEHVSLSSTLAPLIKILPRAETAVTNAYLQPVMQSFLDHIASSLHPATEFTTMTSAGGLEPVASYCPKDGLLSGPAGGVAGAAAVAAQLGEKRILTFDMGGTSTDVARYDGDFIYQFEQKIGDARLMSPALKIETVAAGGGSICSWSKAGLRVGPDSAGADPGPACYGNGGPLTITDINLLLGRIDPENFGIPLSKQNREAARDRAVALQEQAGIQGGEPDPDFLRGLLDIAVEQMADAIHTISVRDGADPSDYALLAFGGAGPQHACDIAERLRISRIIIPAEAGLLSAYGLDQAEIERFAEQQVNMILTENPTDLLKQIRAKALSLLKKAGHHGSIRRIIAEMRWAGQDATLSIEIKDGADLKEAFQDRYRRVFGYLPAGAREVELVSVRAIAATGQPEGQSNSGTVPRPVERRSGEASSGAAAEARHPTGSGLEPDPVECRFLDRASLKTGEKTAGPVIIQDPFSTLFLKNGWEAEVASNGSLILETGGEGGSAEKIRPPEIQRELFRHRFENIVLEMGAMLQRSAISTNVKERADFSCALLSGSGELIANAPHIPVHLGALGLCVREVMALLPLRRGDTVITNHPGIGGSHLPDVTLITPVIPPGRSDPVAFVANRAHHSEIGGITPGSMPPAARSLAEEGLVIAPRYLIQNGESHFETIEKLLRESPLPSRHPSDNLADFNAQLAANLRGVEMVEQLIRNHGIEEVSRHLEGLCRQCSGALDQHLESSGFQHASAVEHLDDGTAISVALSRKSDGGLVIDFAGTTRSHPGNLNATPAIVRSAVLYVLQIWTQSSLPLNEGMLARVEIRLPRCFLNPEFPSDPNECPAVVGGNVETSQRLVDALIKALKIQACSQGTMNNLIFGDDTFGYYETIGGGAGAGQGYHGASGLHTHMTNTAITDPEILENRYPVRLQCFAIRTDSGGRGKWNGGDGLIRELEFLQPLDVSLLTQHRKVSPYGVKGGGCGKKGRQTNRTETLPGTVWFKAKPGDVLRIETPGGGGWGRD